MSRTYRLTELARQIVEILTPGCERICLAGALRRGSPNPKDIDLVVIPKMKPVLDLFGEQIGVAYELGPYISLAERVLGLECDKDGEKLKLFYQSENDAWIDVFIVTPPAQFGAIMAIRTGPSDFSRHCVTSRLDGGAMPMGMRQQDGALWRGERVIPTPEEADWFQAIGIPCWKPEERTVERLRAHLKESAQ